MNRHSKYGTIFFAPDKGGGSGGGAATATSTGSTATTEGADDPWSKINLDDLDDQARAAFDLLKGQFATLQTTVEQKDQQVRQFQSKHDQTTAELNKIKQGLQHVANGGIEPEVVKGPDPAYISAVEQQMIAGGVKPEAAKAQAPIMAQLLKTQEDAIMARVGAGVSPVANMVLNHQAEQAFNYAKATDTTGAFAVPEVAQAVWNSVIEIVKAGQQILPETVQNLKYMHFGAHAEKNPAVFATLQMNSGVPPLNPPGGRPNAVSVTTGGYNYPGANFAPTMGGGRDPNAPRTTLDPGTKFALQSIFTAMKPGHVVQ